jgi:hypothetical protein
VTPNWVAADQSIEEYSTHDSRIDAQMSSDIGNDSGKRANSQWVMIRDRDAVFSLVVRRKPNVAARLTNHLIAISRQRASRFSAGDITRQPHAVMTSSRT